MFTLRPFGWGIHYFRLKHLNKRTFLFYLSYRAARFDSFLIAHFRWMLSIWMPSFRLPSCLNVLTGRNNVFWNKLTLTLFFIMTKTYFFLTSSESLSIQGKRSKVAFLWQTLDHFRVVYHAKFLIIGLQNSVTERDMIDQSSFRVWDSVTDYSFYLTFLNKLLIGSWCNISKSVSHISL